MKLTRRFRIKFHQMKQLTKERKALGWCVDRGLKLGPSCRNQRFSFAHDKFLFV